MNIDSPCTHAEFGDLVGISRQAVGDLVAREILKPGACVREWLLCYCENQRKQAAQWSDTRLSYERSEAQRVSRERNEIRLARDKNEFTSVTNVSIVLAHIGGRVAGRLEKLPDSLQKRCPEISPEGKKIMQIEIAAACNDAVHASLESLAMLDDQIAAAEESADANAEGAEAGDAEADDLIFDEGGADA